MRWWAGFALLVALLAATALILGLGAGRLSVGERARRGVDSVTGPVGFVLSTPIRWVENASDAVGAYFFAGAQNRELKAEIVRDRAWRDRAIALAEENARYRALMRVRTDPPIPMVFARTVLDARGPFSNTRLADAGSDRGVSEGNPVLSDHGLIGRVVGVSGRASRILLLTDVESRTPILSPRTNARAILTGDGGPNPRLDYLRTHEPLRQGDQVLTSGDGGVLPRGLPVGVVFKDFDGVWRVALDADAAPIDYVQLLLFKDFSQLVSPADLAPGAPPSAMTEEPQESIIGASPAATPPAADHSAAKSSAAAAAKPGGTPAVKAKAKPQAAAP